MTTVGQRKRKACQTCTRSKAKCSPFQDRDDLCYRCQRLGKSCVYDETVRKKVPKSRSRVKQLEQRVDTLIDLLAASGQNVGVGLKAEGPSSLPNVADEAVSPQSSTDTPAHMNYATPVETPRPPCAEKDPFLSYDPIDSGLITRDTASKLLKEFGQSFINSFPFVVVPATTDLDAFRMAFPFLFHSIMTVTTYKTPAVQRTLSQELKAQIADRIVLRSHKSLEILQGLLIYGAWYHFFYNHISQQMAMVVQLCVAMVQDLGLSKSLKERQRSRSDVEEQSACILSCERPLAEKRAFLGTYHLAVAFAQAWRKRNTMPYTKYVQKCCKLLVERKEHPSDILIAPLVELSELTSRVNDFFSYDDIECAEVGGEMMLSSAVLHFRRDLDQIRSTIDAAAKNNKHLHLALCLVQIWIYECALHGSFWCSPCASNPNTISTSRTVGLYHCLNAMNTYLNTLLEISQDALHHLAFPAWTGWFYAIIVACKLVFLEDNERRSQTDIESVSGEVSNLFCKFDEPPPYEPFKLPIEVNSNSLWDPIAVARQAEVESLFDQFMKKMEFTIPSDPNVLNGRNPIFDPLFSMICLQRSLLYGFTKRMKEHMAKLPDAEERNADVQRAASTGPPNAPSENDGHSFVSCSDVAGGSHVPTFPNEEPSPFVSQHTQTSLDHLRTHPAPLLSAFYFDSINFDTISPEDLQQTPQLWQDDMLWDTVMDDFTFPL